MLGLQTLSLSTTRAFLQPTEDEEAYRQAMQRSHRELEPHIYPAALEFRFHEGKILLDICSTANGDRMGGFSLHDFDTENRSCELGYWILPEFQGQGIMLELAEALVGSLFKQDRLRRITLICDRRNIRSISLAKRLGFQHEAYLQGLDGVTAQAVIKLIFARYSS